MFTFLYHYWPVLFGVVERTFAIGTSLHALLRKRETRAVIGWVGVIWLSPLIGSLLYCCFGVNRIERKGEKIIGQIDARRNLIRARAMRLTEGLEFQFEYDEQMAEIGRRITEKDLLPGNMVTPLIGGTSAYESMLLAIEGAERSISVCSYIFDNDSSGKLFVNALSKASERGVEIRVLIDDVGVRYSRPTILSALREHNIRAATFLPTSAPYLAFYANLRNHRKIMVIDGKIGFTGGMNIREGNVNSPGCAHPIQDIHFRFEGPVVSDFQETFIADWAFATGEILSSEIWFGSPRVDGPTWARGVPDGPDSDLDHIRMLMLGAVATSSQRIDIMTPYFLPDETLIHALNVANMRGIPVRIFIPSSCNIKLVQWASSDPISRLLPYGCEVYLTPPPFDHSKIMLVDDDWSLIGSSNWDPRSLRLNFEFNVECYGRELNSQLSDLVQSKAEQSTKLSMEALAERSFPIRIRDGIARLAIPYL